MEASYMMVSPITAGAVNFQNPAEQQSEARISRVDNPSVLSAQEPQTPELGRNLAPMQPVNETLETNDEGIAALQNNDQAVYQADGNATQQLAAAMSGVGAMFDAFA
jgi:hypothetical protein